MTQGESRADALEMIGDVMRLWLKAAVEAGMDLPEPQSISDSTA